LGSSRIVEEVSEPQFRLEYFIEMFGNGAQEFRNGELLKDEFSEDWEPTTNADEETAATLG